MGLSKKRKQQLSQMSARAAESHKHRKIDRENERKRRFLRKQREEEDFWDEYEEPCSESSSDESRFEDSSHDGTSSEEDNLDKGNIRGDNICEGLGDDDNGGVQLRVEERIFRPAWKDKAGGYLRGIKGCGSSVTQKREKRRIRELEKSASQTRSIVDMFSIQRNRNQSHNINPTSDAAPAPSPVQPLRKDKVQKVEKLESQTQAVHDLGELLRLKTKQLDNYGHLLDHKSNFYRRHQMVQSFLWMQLNKEKDNPGLNRQGLAKLVAQSFNRRAYTGRKIVQ